MKTMTGQAVETLLRSDPTIKPERLKDILDMMDGNVFKPVPARHWEHPFYTTKETCDLLRCSRTTLFREEKEGRIASAKVRGGKLYRREDLLRLAV